MAKMATNFLLWPNANQEPYSAVLGVLKGLDAKQQFSIWQGEPWKGEFPAVQFSFDPDFPDNTVLSDNLMNRDHMIIASEKLKDFVLAAKPELVECHPVKVKDHKGKPTKPYFMINPLSPIDCLDHDASGAVARPSMKSQILRVNKIVLREEALKGNRVLFRIAGYTQARLVRRDIAQAIEKSFPGIKFRELSAGK
jgi:hypothetical protein